MMAKKRVVIIGGGSAGLTSAYELLKDYGSEQFDVTVFLRRLENSVVFLALFTITVTVWILVGVVSSLKMIMS